MTGEAKSIIKTAICRHEVWLVPDMALFKSMRNYKFTIRCKECGFEDKMDGYDIAAAMERMMELERYEKEQMEIAAHRAAYEDSLDRFMRGEHLDRGPFGIGEHP